MLYGSCAKLSVMHRLPQKMASTVAKLLSDSNIR